MTINLVLDLARGAMSMTVLLAGPLLGVALLVGMCVSVVQAVTSVQEQTLSFVPKLLAIGVCFLILLPWMIQQMVQYTTEIFRSLPLFAG